MTRIVAGDYGGRRLATPQGEDTRPTSDRVREGMFSSLDAAHVLYGRRFLDLYAGSGAVGLEAASRGADHVLLVESDPRAVRVIRENVAALGAGGFVSILAASARSAVAGPPIGGAYDVVFADPPYALDEPDLADVLAHLAENGWLVPGGRLIVERSKRSPEPSWPAGLSPDRSRRYGETVVWYAVANPAPGSLTEDGPVFGTVAPREQ